MTNRDTSYVEYTLYVRKYRTCRKQITIDTITSLTGIAVRAMIKADSDDSAALLEASIALSIVSSKLNIVMLFTAAQTGTLTVERADWDLEITLANGDKKSYIGGPVIIAHSATH